jgi:hypothetical protein
MKRYTKNHDLIWATILIVFIWMLSPVAEAGSFSGKAYFITDPGAPAGVDLTPNTATVNSGNEVAFSTTVTDKYGNTISNPTGLTYWVIPGTGNGTIDQSGNFTATTVGTCIVRAEIEGGLGDQSVVNINPGQVSPSNSTISVSTNQVVADGTSTVTITVTLRDVNNNAVPGKNVAVSSTGTNNIFTGNPGTSDANGRVIVTLASTKAEVKTISARDTSDNIDITQTQDVTFIAGALDHITLDSVSTEQVAGTAINIIARAYDANNNLKTDANDAAVISENTGSASPTAATFVAGVLTVSVTITAATTANTIKVTAASITGESNNFRVYSNVPVAVSFSPASTFHVAVDSKFTYTATFTDAYGNNVDLGYHPWGTPTVEWTSDYGTITPLSNPLQAEAVPDSVVGRLHEVTATLNW